MLNHRRDFLLAAGAALASTAFPVAAAARTFPSKPIQFVVPLAGGGSAELVARLVGEHMGQRWGQPVLVELRPGGGTIIGSNLVAHAPADGHTLLFSANSLVINAKLRSNLPYDGLKAFEPVACMVNSPQVLAVNAASPHQTLGDWLLAARARPGTLSLSSLGPATTQHIAAAMLQHTTGTELIYVPFTGGSLAVNAVLGGHVDTVLANLAEVSAHIESGKLRPLAVTTKERLSTLSQVPTIAESGYPGFEAIAWFGVSVPTGTSRDIVNELSAGIADAIHNPKIQQQLIAHGLQPAYCGPAEFASHIARSFDSYSHIIDEAGIKTDA